MVLRLVEGRAGMKQFSMGERLYWQFEVQWIVKEFS
jgi:hypothetical protein